MNLERLRFATSGLTIDENQTSAMAELLPPPPKSGVWMTGRPPVAHECPGRRPVAVVIFRRVEPSRSR